jgi:hypothetical protein
MNIQTLIQAAGSVTILADRLKVARSRVAKWRDRKKIPILAIYTHGHKMKRIIKEHESQNASTNQAKSRGSKTTQSEGNGPLRGAGGKANNGAGESRAKA